MTARFEGKVVLITGAAAGIGAATARRFAREGAKLVLGDINEDGLAAVAKAVGGNAVTRHTNVAELAEVEALTQAAIDHFGRLDVVFNNAGTGVYGKTPDLEPEAWQSIIAIDLNSVFYGCRAAIPHMRKQGGGIIINTASISGIRGDYGLAAYNAAKGGVINYTRTAAIDHARENIRINAVCPGPIHTGMTTGILQAPPVHEELRRHIPLGRWGEADEVAAVLVFLTSPGASFVNGAIVPVDGGVSASSAQFTPWGPAIER
jgi:meso-butanediol dehydrogenase/(S,S)-butanediol dehydrogenase/diacetyl reductase